MKNEEVKSRKKYSSDCNTVKWSKIYIAILLCKHWSQWCYVLIYVYASFMKVHN